MKTEINPPTVDQLLAVHRLLPRPEDPRAGIDDEVTAADLNGGPKIVVCKP